MVASLVILGILLLLFILLAMAMLLPVRFRFHGVFAPGRIHYHAELKPPLLPWYLKLPALPARRRSKVPGKEPETPRDQAEATAGVIQKLRSFAGLAGDVVPKLQETYPALREALSMALRYAEVERFRLSVSVGAGDAYETALLAGALRALAGVALSIASRKGVRFTERPRVSVRPSYDRACAAAEILFAASVVPWRAVAAGVSLYRQFKRVSRPSGRIVSKLPQWNTKA